MRVCIIEDRWVTMDRKRQKIKIENKKIETKRRDRKNGVQLVVIDS